MPLGTVIARFSMMILYVSGMMFASQLYGIPLSPLQLAEGLFLCALASIAGVGSPMMVSLSLFSLIFVPLGIPYTAVITLHMLVIIAVDPVLTMENTHINSTLTVFLGGVSKKI
jgi:proton glutamate symport protein